MKKFLLGALISTTLAGSAFAEAPSSAFNGFYLGGGLNYTNEKVDFKDSDGEKESSSFKGVGVKIFGGYGALISQGFYLGGELALGYDSGVKKNKDIDIDIKSNKKLNYSIAGRLGYAFANVLPYLKVGYEGRPSIGSVRRNGVILGGGVDYALTKNVFLRAEYVHGFGAKRNLNGANVKTRTDTFLLGAAYKF